MGVWSERSGACDGSPVLDALGVSHGFAVRLAGVDVVVEKAEALERLAEFHGDVQRQCGLGGRRLCLAEQVHGEGVAVVSRGSDVLATGMDALVTQDPEVALGIYVADCCAVYLVDRENGALGLAHSGAKGTRLGVVPRTIEKMQDTFGTKPSSLVVVLSPCIRPPWYEVDFALEIQQQCRNLGVTDVFDSGVCTGTKMDRYYSYRREQGKTGRMLALLGQACSI